MSNLEAQIQQMIKQRDPGMMQALKYVQDNGGDGKAAFEKLCSENGINLSDLGL